MLDPTRTTPEQRPRRPRKIRLDCALYCPHSVRASAGDADCDHDFETAPTVTHADFAVWSCTHCARAFKFETWKTGARAEASRPARRQVGSSRSLQSAA